MYIGYISLCILTSIYLSKALNSIATHDVKPVLLNKNMSAKSFRYIIIIIIIIIIINLFCFGKKT